MKRRISTVAAIGVTAAAGAIALAGPTRPAHAVGAASPARPAHAAKKPVPISGYVVGMGGLLVPGTINAHLSRADGFVMEQIRFPPGASAGWHVHRTPLLVAVASGTLTLYDSTGPKCTSVTYHAGQGFIEPANHVHLARNQGKRTTEIITAYVGVTPHLRHTFNLDALRPRPSKCPASVH